MKRKATVIQSNYIPWKGYFDLIAGSDVLIIYDDVQFTKNDWRNRNKIKTASGLLWLTVPVGQDINRKINEVTIPEKTWQRKHWKTISMNYQKQKGFADFKDFFEDFYMNKSWDNLSAMNEYLIRNILSFLGIHVEIQRSENYTLNGKKDDRLLELLEKAQVTEYVTGPAGLNYIQPEKFREKSIVLHTKQYGPYREYDQPHGPFEHSVSVIDLLCCCGKNAKDFFKS